ncbi:MAG: hypothetical protein AABW75_03945 [Nanoarchaeota archaeon]
MSKALANLKVGEGLESIISLQSGEEMQVRPFGKPQVLFFPKRVTSNKVIETIEKKAPFFANGYCFSKGASILGNKEIYAVQYYRINYHSKDVGLFSR